MKFIAIVTVSMLVMPAAVAEPVKLDSEVRPALPIDNSTTTEDVAIATDATNRFTVLVEVAGRGPYRFLVDTGSERTVISRQLAERLNLDSGRNATLHSVVGVNKVSTVYIPSLKISSNNISVVDAPTLEASNIGADGMLGIDSLRSQRVMFDFKAGNMSITPSKQPAEVTDGQTIVVRARSRDGRLIFTEAKVDGQSVTIIVDTGSQVTIGNLALRRRLAQAGMVLNSTPITVESITGELMMAEVSPVDRLELGGLHFGNLNVAFADAYIFKQLNLHKRPALLLGMNALRAFDRISIDFAAKKVRFVLPGTSMRDTVQLAGK